MSRIFGLLMDSWRECKNKTYNKIPLLLRARASPSTSSNLADKLEQELRVYQGAAQNFTVDRADIPDFTTKVLHWWACNHSKIPNWAAVARINFSLTPSSAACERVLSLLKCMFEHLQASSLADQVQAGLMLRYNDRPC